MSTELEKRETAVAQAAPTIIEIINKLTDSPNLSLEAVQALTQLVQLQRESEAQRRKELFFEALARVQAKAQRIKKDGLMDRGPGKGQIAYAKREDIDAVMRPIYQGEGFSVNWDAPMNDGRIRVIGRFTAHGHTEEREWSCLPDSSGGKQNPQATGSTVSYGQRYISIMFWDIITEDADTNGAKTADVTPITQHQADDIRTRLGDAKQKTPGHLLKALCSKYGVSRPEDIRVSQYDAVIRDVEIAESR